MIAWALLNWKWAAPTAVAAVLSVLLGLTRMDFAQTKANWATERAEAVKAAADFTAKSAAKDATNAELSRDLEATRAKTIADATASADDFAVRLRAATDAARHRCVSAPAAAPSIHADAAPGSNDGRGSTDPGLRLRNVIKALQADVVGCWNWGGSVGR